MVLVYIQYILHFCDHRTQVLRIYLMGKYSKSTYSKYLGAFRKITKPSVIKFLVGVSFLCLHNLHLKIFFAKLWD